MREAMARAELGDDVFGEDPSVNALEAAAAARVGKEAALFVPSGTMANQIAIRLHTHHGDVVLAGQWAHILRYEGGAASALAGVQIATLAAGGLFDADDVKAAIVPATNVHLAPTTLLAAENTHNSSGGRVFPLARIEAATAVARAAGLATHLDGARLFNAEIASGIPAAEWAHHFDTVAYCFSKGLGAPVGSVLCGPRAAIDRARRLRKMLGGGMRQAGVLAAAALHALEHHIDRLADDHTNARRLAEGLQGLPGVTVEAPQTNIVFVDLDPARAAGVVERLRAAGLLCTGLYRLRLVTHLGVSNEDIDRAITILRATL